MKDLPQRRHIQRQQGDFAPSGAGQLQPSKQTPRGQARRTADWIIDESMVIDHTSTERSAKRQAHQVPGTTHLYQAAQRHHRQGLTSELSAAARQQPTGSLTSAGSGICILFGGLFLDGPAKVSTHLFNTLF